MAGLCHTGTSRVGLTGLVLAWTRHRDKPRSERPSNDHLHPSVRGIRNGGHAHVRTGWDDDRTAGTVALRAPALTISCMERDAAAMMESPARPLRLFGVSGKMGSGKDSLAMRALELAGVSAPVQINLADAIRDELDSCFESYRQGGRPALEAHVGSLPGGHSCEPDALAQQALLIDAVIAEVDAESTDQPASSRTRTANVRRGLQGLASIVRSADRGFWVNRLITKIGGLDRSVTSIVTTDIREPGEVVYLSAAGYFIVRVNVTKETQLSRLQGRDGITVDDAALNHPNETALDSMTVTVADAIDMTIDNDGDLESAAQIVAARLVSAWGDRP